MFMLRSLKESRTDAVVNEVGAIIRRDWPYTDKVTYIDGALHSSFPFDLRNSVRDGTDLPMTPVRMLRRIERFTFDGICDVEQSGCSPDSVSPLQTASFMFWCEVR
jgi:hypothetical protein